MTYDGEKFILRDGQTGDRIGEQVYRCEFKGVSDCVRLSYEIAGDHPVLLQHHDLGHAVFAVGDWGRGHPSYASTARSLEYRADG